MSLLLPRVISAQAPDGTIGRIMGDDITVAGAGGAVSPDDLRVIYLASGSQITVHSGPARIELASGGVIGICGPAKMKLLESGGAFTLAMDFGRIHVHLDDATPLTLYSPLVVATPMAISEGPRDAAFGVDVSGTMCVRAARGGVRVEQQLSGSTIIVPEPLEITWMGTALRPVSAPGSCTCEILEARASPPPQVAPVPGKAPEKSVASAENKRPALPSVSREYSILAPAKSASSSGQETPPDIPATEAPVWKVLMPPLRFDAAAPGPPPAALVPSPSDETILLVREVRIEPQWVFRGRVEAGAPSAHLDAQNPPGATQNPSAKTQKKPGGIRGFFRRLFGGGSPCVGVGCSS